MPRLPSPEDWVNEIECGLDYRRRFGVEDAWGKIEAIFYNVHESMANDGPNILLSQGDSMLASLLVSSPRVKVVPATPTAVQKAPLLEALDNQLIDDIQLPRHVENACLNAYLFGRGFLKIGYDSEWGYDAGTDFGGEDNPVGISMTQFSKRGHIEYDQDVIPGMPWVRSVMPHDIVVPWGTRDIQDAQWIAHRVVRHIDDLRDDPKYENTLGLQPQLSMESFVNSYRVTMKRRHRTPSMGKPEFVELWEIWDKKTSRVFVVSRDYGKFLRNSESSLIIEKSLPFVGLSFVPRSRAFWVTPDAYYLLHVQMELSDLAVQRTKQRRLSVLKFIADSNVMRETELAKILSPDVGAVAFIDGGHDLSRAIMKLDNVPNPGLAYEENLLRANAREQIGFSRNQLGEYAGGRKTASEVITVDRSSQLRMSRRGLQVKRFYEDAIRIINKIIFSHWTLARYVRVLDDNEAEQWMTLNGPALEDRFKYNVEFTTESELDARKSRALQLYGMLANDPLVDPIALRQYLVREFNEPGFEGLWNANVRNGLRAVQGGGGGAAQEQLGQPGAMPQMPLQPPPPNGIAPSLPPVAQ